MTPKNIKVFFLHHSTGAHLLSQGKLREQLSNLIPKVELFDHGYNLSTRKRLESRVWPMLSGLTDNYGNFQNIDYQIPDDNTNPDGLAKLFGLDPFEENALGKILKYDVIIYKSCYPVTKIKTNSQLEEYKENHRSIISVIKKYPDKLFLAFTPPPLRYEMTKVEFSTRAREFVEWMKSEELDCLTNLMIFDYFSLLSDNDPKSKYFNTLRRDYCGFLFFDSHPNKKANIETGEVFCEFLHSNIRDFFHV